MVEKWKRGLILIVVCVILQKGDGQLAENFYGVTCSNVESIVKQAVLNKFSQTFTTVPATLRLFFHDCFIEVYIHAFKYMYIHIFIKFYIDGFFCSFWLLGVFSF